MIAKWRLGKDSLIHRVWSLPFVEGDEPYVELVSGADATAELMWAVEADEVEPLFDERGCYGYVYEDIMEGTNRVEFWDCDDESWSEYELKNLTVWRSHESGLEGERGYVEMKELYERTVDHAEYPDFEGWLWDMERSATFCREV